MKKAAVVVLLVIGFVALVRGGRSPKAKAAHAACENVAQVCGKSFGLKASSSDVNKCESDLVSEGPARLGDGYETTVSCMTKADSCGEVFGCMGGAMFDKLENEIDGFARGFGRKTKR